MKVTQEEFDDKRKELRDTQDTLHGIKENVKAMRRYQDDYDKQIDIENQMRNDLWSNEHILLCWLSSAEIEKDLSVEITNQYPYLAPMLIGKYKNKGYLLDQDFDWNFERSGADNILLIPTKKP